MNFFRALAVTTRYLYLLRGNASRQFQLVVWALLDVVLWGFITRYLDSVGQAEFSFVPVLLGAVLLWDFVARVQQGVTTPFLEDVWSRNLFNFFASPLTLTEYLVGLILSSIITSFIGLVVMVAIALGFFGFSLFSFGAMLTGYLFVLFLFGITIGVLATAVVLRFGPSAEWFVWPIPTVLAPFVGVFYPISVLPPWMQALAYVLPPTYVFEGARATIAHASASPTPLLIGFLLGIVYLLTASFIFVLVYKRAVRSGAIARYSAESL